MAQYPIDGTDAQMVYRSADGALLQAKLGGRDRIVPTGWSSSSATPNGVDVALIYPDDTFANAIEEALKTRGYRVQWFTQGREGLRHLSGDPDPLVPRVLLLGEQLPDMTGLECLTQLTASGIGSALPILLVRNLDSFRDLPLGQPYDCLKIPCTISALLQRIHRQLALSANH